VTRDDAELHAVRYAFDAAFRRMCEATTSDALMAELSNLLHHLFRLRELCKDRLIGFYATEKTTGELRAGRAASWARNLDTHQLFNVASQEDVYGDYYTAMFGVLVWKPLSDLPRQVDSTGNHREIDYVAELEGQVVLATMRRAFDALAGLL
jgi:hypothetical protein